MSNEIGGYVDSYANYLQYYFLQSYMDGTLATLGTLEINKSLLINKYPVFANKYPAVLNSRLSIIMLYILS